MRGRKLVESSKSASQKTTQQNGAHSSNSNKTSQFSLTYVIATLWLLCAAFQATTSGQELGARPANQPDPFSFDSPSESESWRLGGSPDSSARDWLRSSFRPPPPTRRPPPPEAPREPRVPSLAESLSLIRRDSSSSSSFPSSLEAPEAAGSLASSSDRLDSLFPTGDRFSTSAPATTLAFEEGDESATRQPMTQFRPTRAPSDESSETRRQQLAATTTIGDISAASGQPDRRLLSSRPNGSGTASNRINQLANYTISNECFECICEASTNCNAQSRCQTSDVRHTRCGLFLLSYDQWLISGLSKQLVSAQALARDSAADERAYYECATSRDCAEQLLAAYMSSKLIDCDRDSRLDCYDVAAVHQAGPEQCASEQLLDSQYWNDFNACYGFARRR